MKWLRVVVVLLCFLAVVGSVSASGDRVGVVGVSHYGDSKLVLAVEEDAVCYSNVSWHIFSVGAVRYEVFCDDVMLANGDVEGVVVRNVTVSSAGLHRLSVSVGGDMFVWNVYVINQSAEKWAVQEHDRQIGLKEFTAVQLLMSVLRTHAVTLVFVVVPLPFVFAFVVERKEKEARRVV